MVVRDLSLEPRKPRAIGSLPVRMATIFLFVFYVHFTAFHLFAESHFTGDFPSGAQVAVDSHHHHDSGHDHDHNNPHVASDHSIQALLKAGSISFCPVFIVTNLTISIEPPTINPVAPFVDCMGPPPKAIPDPLQPRAPPLS
jgi:hypothetical protein